MYLKRGMIKESEWELLPIKNNGIDVVVIAYIVSQFNFIIDIINKYYI